MALLFIKCNTRPAEPFVCFAVLCKRLILTVNTVRTVNTCMSKSKVKSKIRRPRTKTDTRKLSDGAMFPFFSGQSRTATQQTNHNRNCESERH